MEGLMVKEKAKESKGHNLTGGKFLSFFLGDEEYAIDILKVQEIIGLMPITKVPKMPDYIEGVVNLRGKIIPVMNLRSRFGLPTIANTEETVMIVVQDGARLTGVLVDKVSEVVDVTDAQIEDVPEFGIPINDKYLAGIGKINETVKMILDTHRVVFEMPEHEKDTEEIVA